VTRDSVREPSPGARMQFFSVLMAERATLHRQRRPERAKRLPTMVEVAREGEGPPITEHRCIEETGD
jgi:hypothetical protein